MYRSVRLNTKLIQPELLLLSTHYKDYFRMNPHLLTRHAIFKSGALHFRSGYDKGGMLFNGVTSLSRFGDELRRFGLRREGENWHGGCDLSARVNF